MIQKHLHSLNIISIEMERTRLLNFDTVVKTSFGRKMQDNDDLSFEFNWN